MAPSTRVLGCIFVAARAANRRKEETSSKMGSKKKTSFFFPLAASHFIIRRLLTKGSLLSDKGGETRFYSWVYGGWRAATNSPVERDRESPPPPPPHCVKWRSTWGRKNGRTADKAGLQQQGKMRRQRLRLSRRSLDPVEHVPSPSLPPSLLSLLLLFPLLRFCSTGQLAAKSKGGGGVEIDRFAAPPPPHSSRQQHHHHHCCMQSFLPPPPPLFFFSFLVSFPSSSCARIHYPK